MIKNNLVCLLSSILISGQLWATSLQTSSVVNHSTPKTIIQTDDSDLIESFNINPYGKLVDVNSTKKTEAHTISFNQNPFIYGSGYYDTESNLQYMGARYYSSDIGRFMAQDSYDLINRYNYANANPIMNIDPDGHNALGTLAGILEFGAGFIPGVGEVLLAKDVVEAAEDKHEGIPVWEFALIIVGTSALTLAGNKIYKKFTMKKEPLHHIGNKATLREQSITIEKLEQENFILRSEHEFMISELKSENLKLKADKKSSDDDIKNLKTRGLCVEKSLIKYYRETQFYKNKLVPNLNYKINQFKNHK